MQDGKQVFIEEPEALKARNQMLESEIELHKHAYAVLLEDYADALRMIGYD